MTPIFLYTKAAKVPSAHLKALRDGGVLPVQVESLDEARLIDPEHLVSGDVTIRAALRAIQAHSCDSVAKNFVRHLVRQIDPD